jgi:hypothetical protein
MKLILHIGEGKTGSTSIQTALASAGLDQFSILYEIGKESSHFCLGTLLGSKIRFQPERKKVNAQEILRVIKSKISSSSYQYLLLSAENFVNLKPSEVLDFLVSHCRIEFTDIYCICFIREPVSLYMSTVQQELKASPTFILPQDYFPQVLKYLPEWISVIGIENFHLIPFCFPTTEESPESAVQMFSRALSLITDIPLYLNEPKRINASLKAEEIAVLQIYQNIWFNSSTQNLDSIGVKANNLIKDMRTIVLRKELGLTPPKLCDFAQVLLTNNLVPAYQKLFSEYPDVSVVDDYFNLKPDCFPDSVARVLFQPDRISSVLVKGGGGGGATI